MALPPIRTKVDVDSSGFVSGMNAAIGSLGGFSGALKLGGAALVGFAGARGLQRAIAASIQFEQQVAELAKLVGEEQAQPLANSIVQLSNTLPVAADELQRAAQGAARLGIRGTQNITNFTRVMGTIGLVTDTTADEAAVAMARISKVTETPIESVENLASVMNEASNTMAVSFSEVLDSAQRAAPGLAQLGLQGPEIVALSAAVAELSANASRAGTRVNRLGSVLLRADSAKVFAQALGLTADEFVRLREDDPANLILDLAQVLRDGGDAAALMNNELDETSLRVLRTLARNVDDTRGRLTSFNDAFREGTSLQAEFANFASTAAARTQVLRNRIGNLEAAVGDEFLPIWKDLLNVTIQILEGFNRLINTPFERALPTDAAAEMRDLFREIGAETRRTDVPLLSALESFNQILPGAGSLLVKLAEASETTDTELQGLQRTIVRLMEDIDPELADDFVASIRNLARAVQDGRVSVEEFEARVGNLASRYIEASAASGDLELSFRRIDEAIAAFGAKAGTTIAETDRLGSRFRQLAEFVPTSKLNEFAKTGSNIVRSFNPATQSLDETIGALENLAVNAGAVETSVRGLEGATEELTEEEQERQRAIGQIVSRLEDERTEMTEGEAALLRKRLATLGASQATIEYALSLHGEVSALEEEAKAEEEAARQKRRRAEETRRAMEQATEEQRRIRERARERVDQLVSDVRLAKLQEQMRRVNEIADRMAEGVVSAFGEMVGGTQSFGDAFAQMITRILAEIARAQAQKLFSQLISGLAGGIAGVGGDVIPRSAVPEVDAPAAPDLPDFGFQHGGVFEVPGTGGPDSQVVRFMATPGEIVAVLRPRDLVDRTAGPGGQERRTERAVAEPVEATVTIDAPESIPVVPPDDPIGVETPEEVRLRGPSDPVPVDAPESIPVDAQTDPVPVEDPGRVDVSVPDDPVPVEDPGPLGVDETEPIGVERPPEIEVSAPDEIAVDEPGPLDVETPDAAPVEVPDEPLTVEDPGTLEVEPPDQVGVERPEPLEVEPPDPVDVRAPETIEVDAPERPIPVERPESVPVDAPGPEPVPVARPEPLPVATTELTLRPLDRDALTLDPPSAAALALRPPPGGALDLEPPSAAALELRPPDRDDLGLAPPAPDALRVRPPAEPFRALPPDEPIDLAARLDTRRVALEETRSVEDPGPLGVEPSEVRAPDIPDRIGVEAPDRGSVGDAPPPGQRTVVNLSMPINVDAIDDRSVRERVIETGLIEESIRRSVDAVFKSAERSDSARKKLLTGRG